MKTINEFGYHFYIGKKQYKEYEKICYSNKSVREKIYELMTLNPGFMVYLPTYEQEYISKTKDITLKELDKKIQDKKKIVFITFYFNTKPSIREITNGVISPDASDFLVLLHLNTMVYFINKIYEPGCAFKIGSELSYFHHFALVDRKETDEMQDNLYRFNMISEQLIGSQGQVLLYDVLSETNMNKKEFLTKVESEKYSFFNQKNAMGDIEKFSDYYMKNVIDLDKFPNKETALRFAYFHTLDATGYKNALLDMFNTSSGLFKDFDETLYIQSRFVEDSHINEQNKKSELYCSMLPGATTFSFNTITLRTSAGKWKQVLYEEVLEKDYQPVFVQELKYPFFFVEEEEGVNIGA